MKRNYLLGIISIILFSFLFSCVSENTKLQNRKEVFLKNSEKLNDKGETVSTDSNYAQPSSTDLENTEGIEKLLKDDPEANAEMLYISKEVLEKYQLENIVYHKKVDGTGYSPYKPLNLSLLTDTNDGIDGGLTGGINLSWEDGGGSPEKYEILKKSSGSTTSTPDTVTAQYFDNNILPGVEYCYQVRGYRTNSGVNAYSEYSDETCLTGELGKIYLKASYSNNQAVLNWNPVRKATGYSVYKGSTEITTTGTSYSFSQTENSAVYQVKAKYYDNFSIYSNSVTVYKPQTPTVLPVPTGFTVESPGLGYMYLKWNLVSGMVDGYRIYRKLKDESNYTYLGKVNSYTNEYDDPNDNENKSIPPIDQKYYIYQVCSYQGDNLSQPATSSSVQFKKRDIGEEK